MPLDEAFDKTFKEFREMKPYVAASKSAAIFDGEKFILPLFNKRYYVYYPSANIVDEASGQPPIQPVQLLLLHYLITADGAAVEDMWITYRNLAPFFELRFDLLVLNKLTKAFGNNPEGFHNACLSLGGTRMNRMGDEAFRFVALPQVPVACILYSGDEEVPSSMKILFDASITHYLPVEDISYLCSYLGSSLRSFRQVS